MKLHIKIRLYFVIIAAISLFISLIAYEGAAFAEIKIIVNKSVKNDTLTRAEIKEIFKGQMILWNDNTRIHIATITSGQVHKEFVRTYINKTEAQFRGYWRYLVFTGKGTISRSFDTEKEIEEYVAKTNGCIGYVSSEHPVDNVKVISVSDK